jgi:hypothetical protein
MTVSAATEIIDRVNDQPEPRRFEPGDFEEVHALHRLDLQQTGPIRDRGRGRRTSPPQTPSRPRISHPAQTFWSGGWIASSSRWGSTSA